jgi:ribosomal protein L7Ae-like RNA K-turn-binding protein
MKQDRLLSLIGLAQKAGKVASGEFSTERSVKDGKAYCVIVAADASDNTKKNFTDMCSYYQIPVYFYGNKETIGRAIGKEFRASMAVNDEGFAKNIAKQITVLSSEGEINP